MKLKSTEYDRVIVRYWRAPLPVAGLPVNLTRFPDPAETGRSRAASLRAAFARATESAVVAWIDPRHHLSESQLATLCQALDDPEVAAATITGFGRTLTRLGAPVAVTASPRDGRHVLYAPAGLAAFRRDRVLSVGGVDPSLIYGHEDANLGWRLALRGFRTVEVPGVVTTDGPTGETGDPIVDATRLRHETANQLATLFVCAGDDWLRSALPAALARIICLAASDAGVHPEQFDFTVSIPATFALPVRSIARLLALDDLIRHLPALKARRAFVQSEREYNDDEIHALFDDQPVDAEWENAAGEGAHALCRMLGVAPLRDGIASHSSSTVASPREDDSASAKAAASTLTPRVSVVVLTALGPKHLPECLDSLAKLDYPPDSVEVIVVDNGSKEDPTETVRRHYPTACVVRNGRNLGFCGGNNAGAARAKHEWLLFLNDDTRVDPGLLRELFATSTRRGAAAVGAFVLDWSGSEVDFAGGGMSFEGNGFQDGIGSSDTVHWRRERPIPFANGAAMLVRRDAYIDSGGFPDSYFAYYEDVALGWALWMEGQQVWLSPDALVYHKHHGTAQESPSAARQRNCERNARFTVLTHASPEALPDLLSASLLMAAERVVMAGGLGGMVDDPLALVNDHRLGFVERLDPRIYVRQLRAEFRRQGGKRQFGVIGSLARVGVSGLFKSFAPLYQLARWGGTKAPLIGSTVAISSQWAATLAATAEWCRRAAEVESLRTILQTARREDEHQFAARFPKNWLHPVLIEPSRQGEYERAHHAVIRQFELARFLR